MIWLLLTSGGAKGSFSLLLSKSEFSALNCMVVLVFQPKGVADKMEFSNKKL